MRPAVAARWVFHKLIRLRSAKEYPLMIETTYLPQSRFMSLDTEILSNGSLYDFLRSRYGFHADRASETLRLVMPRPDERTLLNISANTPCMLLERFSYKYGQQEPPELNISVTHLHNLSASNVEYPS